MRKPIIALTTGDPCGIGPEVLLKSLEDRRIYDLCSPFVIGDSQSLIAKGLRSSLNIHPILNPAQAQFKYGVVDLLHIPNSKGSLLKMGQPNRISARNSALAVEKSIELCLLHLCDAVVHGPISKVAWKRAGFPSKGQTEFIAQMCSVKKVAMAIVSDPLYTVLVTRHVSIKNVPRSITQDKIIDTILLTYHWMKKLKLRRPKILVCALNPHAGESGNIGTEEIKIITPAVRMARLKIDAEIQGPLSADVAFQFLKNGLTDCLITLYHDQSLIPLKLYNDEKLVNITLGLPFPRTSPGHGTAFEIAGKNRANPSAMKEAIRWAAKLAKNR